jgi:LuxR family maltose regulon positive regulatory protein
VPDHACVEKPSIRFEKLRSVIISGVLRGPALRGASSADVNVHPEWAIRNWFAKSRLADACSLAVFSSRLIRCDEGVTLTAAPVRAERFTTTRTGHNNRRAHSAPDPPPPGPIGDAVALAMPIPFVSHERLLRRLDDAMASQVVLLSAPAGWGKTTLVSSWVAAGRPPGNVLIVSMADKRAVRDLSELRYAVSQPQSRAGPEPTVLVADDVHRADLCSMAQLRGLLGVAPSRLRVVLLTRSDPPLPLYRWRLTGRLGELRVDDLSLTVDETGAVLQAFGVNATPAAVRALRQFTDGWPAAVALAASAASARPESGLIGGELCAGTARMAEYVRAEILEPLPADLRALLPQLSVLDIVGPGLVEALTGRPDGSRVLADLERETGLVRRGGGVEPWYRCHDLLRAVLHDELGQGEPGRVVCLHRAAADWFVANHMFAHALAHALSAADWSRATQLLRDHWPELLAGRAWAATVAVAQPVAPDGVSVDAWLALAFAVQRRVVGDLHGMRQFFRTAMTAAGPRPSGSLARVMAAIRMVDAQAEGDPPGLRAAARRVEESPTGEAAPNENAARVLAWCAQAEADLATLDMVPMERTVAKAMSLARRTGSAPVYIGALGQAAVADFVSGRLTSAAHHARLLLGAADKAGKARIPDVLLARTVLAGVCVERGQADEADYHLEIAAAGDVPVDPVAATLEWVTRARRYQLTGDIEQALQVVRDGHDGRRDDSLPAAAVAGRLLAAELWLAAGRPQTALRLLRDSAARLAARMSPVWAATVETKLRLAAGRPEEALLPWHRLRLEDASPLVAVEGYLVRAQALDAAGRAVASWRLMERALQTAEPERIARPFLANAGELRPMLVDHLSTGSSHAGLLVNLIRSAGSPSAAVWRSAQLVEALTERESVVLRYLNSTLSTAEIANLLDVSANTIKTHVKNVYRKLDVTRRRDAVRRGHELGFG